MFVSYVLRVRPEETEPGRFTAQIEAVATGERSIVHTSDEIMDFVAATMATQRDAALAARERAAQ